MNIELKNNFLYFKNYKLRCAVGKRGITLRKKEGDKKTPKGIFSIRSIFYRKDRISKITSVIRKKIIKCHTKITQNKRMSDLGMGVGGDGDGDGGMGGVKHKRNILLYSLQFNWSRFSRVYHLFMIVCGAGPSPKIHQRYPST